MMHPLAVRDKTVMMHGFANRPPSQTWEPLHVGNATAGWVWFKPADLSDGVVFNLVGDQLTQLPGLTPAALVAASGVDPQAVSACAVQQQWITDVAQIEAFLHQPLQVPPRTALQLSVRVAMASPVQTVAQLGHFPVEFQRITTEWLTVVQIESNLTLLRKKLADQQQRLVALNRDLTPDERLHGDRKDKTEWQNARRSLREHSTRVSKSLKDHDIGVTSNAGRRKQFEEIYQQYIVPRTPCEGLAQVQRDFESYRKIIQTLQIAMNTTFSMAAQDGENRANDILRRIAASVRRGQRNR